MEHIDLFSGIGGFALAAKWTGFETVAFCEKDEFCQKVLQKRFGGFIADSKYLRKLQSEGGKQTQRRWLGNIPIIPEIRDFDGTKWRGATLLTGGFPCQPFSVAGKRRGKEDDRYLWPEMFRVIKEAKPRWILAENVAGIFKLALDTVLADLESEGYTTGTVVIPAAGINAPHRRDRIWIIANNISQRQYASKSFTGIFQCKNGESVTKDENQDVPDSIGYTISDGWSNRFSESIRNKSEKSEIWNCWEENWIEVATRFCRMDDGVSNRVDRLKSLGNAIVPQVAAEIMGRITMIM